MNILLIEEDELTIPANDRRVEHVRKILKLQAGDHIRAGIVNGATGTALIERLDKSGMTIQFTGQVQPAADSDSAERGSPAIPPPAVDLLLGHPRPIVLRRMLRDLCTIGVRRLVVTPTDLGERSYLGATMWREIRPLLIEGAAQAGVTTLMEVTRCHSLARALAAVCGSNQRRVALHPDPRQSVEEALASTTGRDIVLAVGSERGWTESELESLTGAGFEVAGLGNRILRTETAAVVAGWVARVALDPDEL